MDFYCATLAQDLPPLFSKALNRNLKLFGITGPSDKLTRIKVTNEDKQIKKHNKNLKDNFEKVCQDQVNLNDYKEALLSILSFVYAVQCNIFYGTKTKIEMEDTEQQSRMLIYTAILIALNGLLFEIVKKEGISWKPPRVQFDKVVDHDDAPRKGVNRSVAGEFRNVP